MEVDILATSDTVVALVDVDISNHTGQQYILAHYF
jgi:hypothetical protein